MSYLNTILFLIFFILLYYLKIKNFSLSLRVMIGLLLGIVLGFLIQYDQMTRMHVILLETLNFIGAAYLRLLKMLVFPLILTSIIHAILNLNISNTKILKRISIGSISLLLGLTSLASGIGIIIGMFMKVGAGISLPYEMVQHPLFASSLANTFLNMIPNNLIKNMLEENTIAILIFALLIAIAARKLDKIDHEKMQTFDKLIASLFAIIKNLALVILSLTPYAVLALISYTFSQQGVSILNGLAHFILSMYVAMFFVLLLHTFLLASFGYQPISYFKNAITALFVAFTTRSSFGTLPVTEETLRKNFKSNPLIASFVPSIGATIGMNACAGVYPAMLTVMTLNILHEPLTLPMAVLIMLINMLSSLGVSGLPGSAYIAATATLTTLGLPLNILGFVQSIDPIVDMGRTAVNVNGVITTALITNRFVSNKKYAEHSA